MVIYDYDQTNFLNATKVNIDDLQTIIQNSAISSATIINIGYSEGPGPGEFSVEINFSAMLSAPDLVILDNIIENYVYYAYADIYANVKDIKAAGTNGGTFTSGTWQTRTLNTIEGDMKFASLSSNRITLQPGSYIISARVPACDVRNHQCRLQNITDSITEDIGTASFAFNGIVTVSELSKKLVLEEAKTYEIQHRCSDTATDIGFGKATGFNADEMYTVVIIELL